MVLKEVFGNELFSLKVIGVWQNKTKDILPLFLIEARGVSRVFCIERDFKQYNIVDKTGIYFHGYMPVVNFRNAIQKLKANNYQVGNFLYPKFLENLQEDFPGILDNGVLENLYVNTLKRIQKVLEDEPGLIEEQVAKPTSIASNKEVQEKITYEFIGFYSDKSYGLVPTVSFKSGGHAFNCVVFPDLSSGITVPEPKDSSVTYYPIGVDKIKDILLYDESYNVGVCIVSADKDARYFGSFNLQGAITGVPTAIQTEIKNSTAFLLDYLKYYVELQSVKENRVKTEILFW